jgi:hypothetical protein
MVTLMAKEITYDRLFNDIIEAIRLKIPDRDAAFVVERSFPAILREYSGINRYVKAVYMRDPNGFLDRHKCGACFMVAFMRNLIIPPDKKACDEYREKIAILAGLTVMGTLIMGDNDNYKNAVIIAYLTENGGFAFPDLLCDTVEYDRIWAFELRTAYKAGTLSVLSLAHELFLIESYSRLKAEAQAAAVNTYLS